MPRTRSKSMFVERTLGIENDFREEIQEKAKYFQVFQLQIINQTNSMCTILYNRKITENRAMNRVRSPSKRSQKIRKWKKDSKKFEALILMVKQNLAKVYEIIHLVIHIMIKTTTISLV